MAEQGPLAGRLLRLAARAGAGLMRDVGRAVNVVALGHVFPPEEPRYPGAAVEQRPVELVLEGPGA